MIKNIKSSLAVDLASVTSEGNQFVAESWKTPYNTPLGDKMEKAYEINVRRTAMIHSRYGGGDSVSRQAVEAYVTGNVAFNNPPSYLADQQDRSAASYVRGVEIEVRDAMNSGKLSQSIAMEFLHTISDFPTLTQACVQRSLKDLSSQGICEADCLTDVFYNKGAIDPCATSGHFSLIPVQAPSGAGCPHGSDEECDCRPAYWQFGETGRGDFGVNIFKDAISWSWWLSKCAQYGGFDTTMLSWILRIKQERKESLRASMLGNSNGINGNIFNAANKNVLVVDSVTNPKIECVPDAIKVLEAFAKHNAYLRDADGLLNCATRPYRFITPDWTTKCIVEQALEATIETASTVTGNNCVSEIRTTAPGCFPNIQVCYSNRLREVMGSTADGTFFILPASENSVTGRNAFEEATMQGLETVQLVRKSPMFTNMAGRPLTRLGSDICFNQEIWAMDSYGAGTTYPELAFASNGSETP